MIGSTHSADMGYQFMHIGHMRTGKKGLFLCECMSGIRRNRRNMYKEPIIRTVLQIMPITADESEIHKSGNVLLSKNNDKK